MVQLVIKAVLGVLDALSIYSGRLFAYLSLPVIAVIMTEVVGRYLFRSPFLWSHETMTFLAAGVYMLGGGYVLYHRGHTSVDILTRKFSPRARAITGILTSVFFYVYIITLLRVVYKYTATSLRILEKSGTPWNPPIYPLKIALLAAVILILLAGIGNLIRDVNTAVTGKESLENGSEH